MYCIRNLRYDLIEYVKLLLKYGADVNYTINAGTALHYTAQNNDIEATVRTERHESIVGFERIVLYARAI